MLPLIGVPQGAEWLVIMAIAGGTCVVPVALVVWLTVRLARRRPPSPFAPAGSARYVPTPEERRGLAQALDEVDAHPGRVRDWPDVRAELWDGSGAPE
jgi:hypothetical protein